MTTHEIQVKIGDLIELSIPLDIATPKGPIDLREMAGEVGEIVANALRSAPVGTEVTG